VYRLYNLPAASTKTALADGADASPLHAIETDPDASPIHPSETGK
jgi:hypothetical protein